MGQASWRGLRVSQRGLTASPEKSDIQLEGSKGQPIGWAKGQSEESEGQPERSEGQCEGSEGQPEESEGQQKGSESQPEWSEGQPDGSKSQLEGSKGQQGGV